MGGKSDWLKTGPGEAAGRELDPGAAAAQGAGLAAAADPGAGVGPGRGVPAKTDNQKVDLKLRENGHPPDPVRDPDPHAPELQTRKMETEIMIINKTAMTTIKCFLPFVIVKDVITFELFCKYHF